MASESFTQNKGLERCRRPLHTDALLSLYFSTTGFATAAVNSYLNGIGGKINQSNGLEKVIIICDKRRTPASLMSHRPQTLLLRQSISELLDTQLCGNGSSTLTLPTLQHRLEQTSLVSSPACHFLLLCRVLWNYERVQQLLHRKLCMKEALTETAHQRQIASVLCKTVGAPLSVCSVECWLGHLKKKKTFSHYLSVVSPPVSIQHWAAAPAASLFPFTWNMFSWKCAHALRLFTHDQPLLPAAGRMLIWVDSFGRREPSPLISSAV